MSDISIRIGVDTGGTFTDFVCLTAAGQLRVHKLRSNPADPSSVILAGIADLLREQGSATAEVTHGSTVATNAVLERKGARIAMVVTAGFEDVLRIGRQTRPSLYDFMVQAPRPLVEDHLTFGIPERLAADGAVVEPLTDLPSRNVPQDHHGSQRSGDQGVHSRFPNLVAALNAAEVRSIAVCLLHSYANPAHEQQLSHALRDQGFQVSASHEILPEYREFERWSTTAVNAYVTPLMAAYLTRLDAGLNPLGSPHTPLRIMQSNGGSISAAQASRAAVQTILSGPAAGVVGAQTIARASGFERLIAFDMGGTSTDVSLVDGAIGTTTDSLVGDLPVRLPVLDIHTVGAGGGSIAWLDSGGSLRVGPRSAGADPGPVCYGKGAELTVTDANLLLGRLDPAWFLGGRMALDLPRTEAIAAAFAQRLNLTPHALAEGIVRIADANMERAIRVVSVERGHDPRDFALVAFGGAGGLHACALAESLDIPTVLIPEHSGVLSALGMLAADVVRDYSASILRPAETLTASTLRSHLAPLEERAQAELAAEGFAAATIELSPTLDMRYKGQAYEIAVPLMEDFIGAFHQAHQRLYGYSNPTRPAEAVQLRLKATGRTTKPSFTRHGLTGASLPQPSSTRQIVFNGAAHLTPIYHRDALSPGMQGGGPAIILTGQSTNVIAPHWRWTIDPVGTLIATR